MLRGGKAMVVDTDPAAMSDGELIQAMVGRAVRSLPAERVAVPEPAQPALELRAVTVQRHREQPVLDAVDLSVAAGELVGVAGVAGNGQRELYEVALGLLAPTAGQVLYRWHFPGR